MKSYVKLSDEKLMLYVHTAHCCSFSLYDSTW